MPIDYSKWDNLEISDDSDVEIHPNIEKNTFIRLRQRKIREDRENRRRRREGAESAIPMTKNLTERVTQLRNRINTADQETMESINKEWAADLEVARKYTAKRDEVIAQKQKAGEELNEFSMPLPSEEEMIATLKARISDDLLKAGDVQKDVTLEQRRTEYTKQLDGHIDNLKSKLVELEKELEEVKREEAKHIAPDSITHSGFDKSFVSKSKDEPPSKQRTTTKATVTTEEVLNPDVVEKPIGVASSPLVEDEDADDELDEDGDLKLDADAKKFASLSNMSDSMDYIHKNLQIVSEAKADQILGHAFTLQIDGNGRLARQYVQQSLILTYILQLGASGVNMFFRKIGSKGPGQDSFMKDVQSRYDYMVERCKVIKAEREQQQQQKGDGDGEREIESIQLQCDDPNAPIKISIPSEKDAESSVDGLELFNQLPKDFQDALKVGTLDAVNKVLASMAGSEAERMLDICNQGHFLVIEDEIIVDPNEK